MSAILDVEVAFLNGDLEETNYMQSPEEIECKDDETLLQRKSIYGLVQAARQFFIKFNQV
jgi:Reverse transcriptase (RNA-dependent DNA polymerase)